MTKPEAPLVSEQTTNEAGLTPEQSAEMDHLMDQGFSPAMARVAVGAEEVDFGRASQAPTQAPFHRKNNFSGRKGNQTKDGRFDRRLGKGALRAQLAADEPPASQRFEQTSRSPATGRVVSEAPRDEYLLGPVHLLDINDGIAFVEDLPRFQFDPEELISGATFLQRLGLALHHRPPETTLSDERLGVTESMYQKACPNKIEEGLYIAGDQQRAPSNLIAYDEGGTSLHLRGVVAKDIAVAVPDAYKRLLLPSASEQATFIRGALIEDLPLRGGLQVVEAMIIRRRELANLEAILSEKRDACARFYASIDASMDSSYRAGQLNQDRMVVETTMHQALNAAAPQLGYGRPERVRDVHRAMAFNFYRRQGKPGSGPSENIKENTVMAGRHINAIRGKVNQLYNACGDVQEKTFKEFDINIVK